MKFAKKYVIACILLVFLGAIAGVLVILLNSRCSLECIALRKLIGEMPQIPPITFVKLEDEAADIPWNASINTTVIRRMSDAQEVQSSFIERSSGKRGVVAVIRRPRYTSKEAAEIEASYQFEPQNGKVIEIYMRKDIFGWRVIGSDVKLIF